jgi:hypothetical protein
MTSHSELAYMYMFVIEYNKQLPNKYTYRNDDGIYCCKVVIAASSLFEAAIILHNKDIKIVKWADPNKTD